MKKVLIIAMALTFACAGVVVAAKVKCTVDEVNGDKVTMTCKNADKLEAGDKVTVKKPKNKALEGC